MSKKYEKIRTILESPSTKQLTGWSDFSGSLDTLIDILIGIKNENPEFTHIELDLNIDSYGYDCHVESNFTIIGERLETDEERKDRLALERKNKAITKQKLREQREQQNLKDLEIYRKLQKELNERGLID